MEYSLLTVLCSAIASIQSIHKIEVIFDTLPYVKELPATLRGVRQQHQVGSADEGTVPKDKANDNDNTENKEGSCQVSQPYLYGSRR